MFREGRKEGWASRVLAPIPEFKNKEKIRDCYLTETRRGRERGDASGVATLAEWN